MKLLKLKFRKRVFCSFQAWYSKNQAHFGRKLSVIKGNKSRLVLAVDGIPKQVMTILFVMGCGKSRLLDVSANFHLNGECLDSAGWFDAQRVTEGYRCSLCEDQGNPTVYPSLDALWENHVFEPLMAWINEELKNLVGIDFCRISNGGMTWVDLIQDEAHRKADETIASFSMSTIVARKGCFCDVGTFSKL